MLLRLPVSSIYKANPLRVRLSFRVEVEGCNIRRMTINAQAILPYEAAQLLVTV